MSAPGPARAEGSWYRFECDTKGTRKPGWHANGRVRWGTQHRPHRPSSAPVRPPAHQLRGRPGEKHGERAKNTRHVVPRGHVFCYSLMEQMETRCGRVGSR